MTGQPPWQPPANKSGRKTNWAAVSAVAAVAGVLVALITHVPGGASTPSPVPNPNYSQESPTNGAPPPQGLAQDTLGPQSAGPPPGCQQGSAAITRYSDTVGSTPYSEQQAAGRAEQDTYQAALSGNGAIAAVEGANDPIQEDLLALSRDFDQLAGLAGAAAAGGPDGGYSTMYAQTQKDVQVFNKDCNAAG